ncbi:type IV pilin protein [Cellvibrio fibrivorans]|jgi:type IV pilus assembly protein PilE|uniref:Type IV pilus assembly protein PilE n=1 Tax=Cellvibrio fibrivorans TaxID=126350 RepID=A0ABU1V178_9GAMM|nr:type IV pilin protein [Cellvibrio fibrivorans]MDR7091132.1 type IV pilus assembly protein PilE [Cellvibrio fibrivorans]
MKLTNGFTLIELMIVVAVVGIIAAIAYPSYMESVRKSNRAEAKVELMDISQRLQRCYSSFARFDNAANCPVYADLIDGGIETRGAGYYRITIAPIAGGVAATSFELLATAIKAPQTKDLTDGCNEMRLRHTGVQLPDACW